VTEWSKRFLLEYCPAVWKPTVYIGHMKRIEAVQRRFANNCLVTHTHIIYVEELRLLGAESLELLRLKLHPRKNDLEIASTEKRLSG